MVDGVVPGGSGQVLPRCRPRAQQVSSRAVVRFLDAVADDPRLELHSLMVVRHGCVVAEGWWAPYTADGQHLLYSVSKSFTSTALGFALAEGLLGLDDRVVDHFPAYAGDAVDERVRDMTVEHLARMATGHTEDTLDRILALDLADPVQAFLTIPPDEPVGTVFAYHNAATYVLGAILQQVTGMSLSAYLEPRLFAPLGLRRPFWTVDAYGRELALSGLHLTTEALAAFGQLYLSDGDWGGQQLLPVGWVEAATGLHTDNAGEPEPDWQQGYGYQFWRSRHGYRADGAFGQFCLVLPEHDAVIVTTGATEHMQALLDHVWAELLPGFEQYDDAADDDELARRLETLALDPSAPTAFDTSLRVLDVAEDGAEGWTVILHDADEETWTLPVHRKDWHRSEHLRGGQRLLTVSYGDEVEGALVVDVVFVETPHRMRIRRECDSSTSVRWHTMPLRPRPFGLLTFGTPASLPTPATPADP